MEKALMIPEAKELPLKNFNNCLACDAFVYITFAPAKGLSEDDLQRIYYTKNGGEEFYSRIVDIQRFDFWRMPSLATLPATGMEGHEWAKWWIEQYPETAADTKMAVYYYKKIVSPNPSSGEEK